MTSNFGFASAMSRGGCKGKSVEVGGQCTGEYEISGSGAEKLTSLGPGGLDARYPNIKCLDRGASGHCRWPCGHPGPGCRLARLSMRPIRGGEPSSLRVSRRAGREPGGSAQSGENARTGLVSCGGNQNRARSSPGAAARPRCNVLYFNRGPLPLLYRARIFPCLALAAHAGKQE